MEKLNTHTITLAIAFIVACTIVTVISLAVTRSMIDSSSPRIAIVDVNALVDAQQEEMRKKLEASIDKKEGFKAVREQAMKQSLEYTMRLKNAISQIATECQCAVFRADTILAGKTIDMTNRAKEIANGGLQHVVAN